MKTLRSAVLAMLKSVATKKRLIRRSGLKNRHLKALAEVIDSDSEWVAKWDKYDEMQAKCYDQEYWRPEYLYFAEKNGVIVIMPKWDFHHEGKVGNLYGVEDALPTDREEGEVGACRYCEDGGVLYIDDANSKESKPASPEKVKAYKELLIKKGFEENPGIIDIYHEVFIR
jgi:hypothetical protein